MLELLSLFAGLLTEITLLLSSMYVHTVLGSPAIAKLLIIASLVCSFVVYFGILYSGDKEGGER
jgi:hypothetical protein